MMNKILSVSLTLALGMTTMYLFFRQLDSAIEIDDLKSQIRLQKESLVFLQAVADSSLSSSCTISIEQFETIAHANTRNVLWQKSIALVGPYRVSRNESCITKIELVGL
jgi:hypothetical protein